MIVLFKVVADILCEFLEVAIHLILYVREVYPSGIFQKRKKYNVPVQVRDTPGWFSGCIYPGEGLNETRIDTDDNFHQCRADASEMFH